MAIWYFLVKLLVYVTRFFWIRTVFDLTCSQNITCNWHTFIHLGGNFSVWDKVYHVMGDQVVAGDTYEEEEEESFFQDVDMLQSYGIVSWIITQESVSFLESWWLFSWLRNSLSFMELEDYYMHWTQPWHRIYLYNFTSFLLYKKYLALFPHQHLDHSSLFLHYRFSD